MSRNESVLDCFIEKQFNKSHENMNQQTTSGFQWLVVRRRLYVDMQASLERFETVKQCVKNTTVSKIN